MARFNVKVKPMIFLISVMFAQQALASGYHFGTQSVTAQSTANAAAAEAANASTIFTNPAGLTHLPNHQISGTLNLVAPYIKYSNAQAQYYRGGEVSGKDNGKITDDLVLAPHLYGAYKLNDKVTLGLGVYVPFGSETEYDQDSKLRYNLNQLGLKTFGIEPVVSFKVADKHSIGVGLIAQYSKANMRKYADWSAGYNDATLTALAQAGRVPTTNRDAFAGYATVKGDDWGFGYHLGWLYDVNDRTRIGASYRSAVKHNLSGTADWNAEGAVAKQLYNQAIGLPISQGGSGYVDGEKASIRITTPESASIHAMHKATDKLNLYGDVTWTRHSRFQKGDMIYENQKRTPEYSTTGITSNSTSMVPKWRDTFKVAVGGSYQLTNPLQIRAGIAFDQSPVRSAETRLNTLPDGNRIWYSAGIKYDFKKGHSLDVAYSHIHINDTSFVADKASGNTVDSKGTTSANFKNYANILGLQYTYQF